MDNEQKFWLTTWSIIGTVVCFIALCITVSDMRSTSAVESMVKGGTDPVAAACAVRTYDAAICARK